MRTRAFTLCLSLIYVMVQNVRHKNGDFPINNASAGTIRLTFDFSKASVDAYLDATLAAGDALLFKYDTGAAFALQP